MVQFEKIKNRANLKCLMGIFLILGIAVTAMSCDNEDMCDKIIEFEHRDEFDELNIYNISRELLVFIQSGYLESLPTSNNNQRFIVRSKELKTAIKELNVIFIIRALPDWPEEDPLSGRPQFDRLFRFLFETEQEAIDAIDVLKRLPGVVYAERNRMPSLPSLG